MKKIFSLFSILLFLTNFKSTAQTHGSANSGLVWHTNLQKADSLSKLSNKPIFAFFTGSDWCGWCHKLQRDVFAKPEFIAWAKKNVILLELDFPRTKQLSPNSHNKITVCNKPLASVVILPFGYFLWVKTKPRNKKHWQA